MRSTLTDQQRDREDTRTLSQTDFCGYLGEDSSNVAARAKRRGFNTTEDYLKTIAQERRGEIWQREPGVKGKWVKQTQ